jgi:nicotinamide riboside kinase
LEQYVQARQERAKSKEMTTLDHAFASLEKSEIPSRMDMVQVVLEGLLAGVDTSSVTLFYTVALLAENPDALQKVAREIEEFTAAFGLDSETLPAGPSTLPFMQACLRESMRLTPVGPIIMRKAAQEDHVDGVDVFRDDNIIINLAAMNRRIEDFADPADALAFRPERFLREDGTLIPLQDLPFGHFPFGAGPKGCVGQHLALREMMSVLVLLLTRFVPIKPLTSPSMKSMRLHWDVSNQPRHESDAEMYLLPTRSSVRHDHDFPLLDIFFVGCQSSGKTFLSELVRKQLGDHVTICGEFARAILAERGLTGKDLLASKTLYMDFQRTLVERHAELIANAKGNHSNLNARRPAATLRIVDRSALDAYVYAAIRFPEEAQTLAESEAFRTCLDYYQQSRVLTVLFPAVPALWRSDGIRIEASHAQLSGMTQQYRNMLDRFGVPYVELPEKNLDLRLGHIMSIIMKRLHRI